MELSLSQWRSLGQTFQHEGQSIFYRREGSGTPVIALHGYPLSSWDFSRVWSRLTASHDVIAPDMMGFGFSSKPRDAVYSIETMVNHVEALMASLGISRAHCLGFDLGTAVVQELLARFEQGNAKVAPLSVCFLNGSLFPEVYRPRFIQKVLASPMGSWVGPRLPRRLVHKAMVSTFGPDTRPTPNDLEQFSQLIESGDGLAVTHRLNRLIFDRRLYRDRWVSAMQQTRIPMRLVNGEADPNSGAHMMQRYKELIPSPDIVSVGSTIGHWPLFEAPEASGIAITEFWNRVES